MERRFQTQGDPSAPLVQRLTNLETRLFGSPRSGSMIERLNGIKSAANQMPPPNQNAPMGWQPNSPPPQQNGWPPNQQQNGGWNQNPNPNPGWNLNPQPSQTNGWNSSAYPNKAPEPAGEPGINPNAKINAGPGWLPSATPPPEMHPEAQNPVNTQAAVPAGNLGPVHGWQPGMELHPPAKHNQHPVNKPVVNQPAAQDNRPASNFPNSQPMRMVSTPLPVPGAGLVRKNFEPDALPLLNAFPPTLSRMEPDNTALIARPDYYNDVLKASKGRAIRYKNMPVPVYIQPFPDKGFMNCVVRAFESWEMRTQGAVRFVQIDNPNQARIQVVWKHLGADKDKAGCLLGAHTILKYTNHGNGSLSLMSVGAVPVPVYIPRFGPKYTVPPQVMEVNLDLINTKEQSVKYQCLQNIVTHELGHALGMLGHSPNQADIMFPVTDEYSRLSQRDINTVKKLYNQKCDLPL